MAVAKEMEIAAHFGSRVQGDDGEWYEPPEERAG